MTIFKCILLVLHVFSESFEDADLVFTFKHISYLFSY
jgi:hypothetical protein